MKLVETGNRRNDSVSKVKEPLLARKRFWIVIWVDCKLFENRPPSSSIRLTLTGPEASLGGIWGKCALVSSSQGLWVYRKQRDLGNECILVLVRSLSNLHFSKRDFSRSWALLYYYKAVEYHIQRKDSSHNARSGGTGPWSSRSRGPPSQGKRLKRTSGVTGQSPAPEKYPGEGIRFHDGSFATFCGLRGGFGSFYFFSYG